MFTLRFSRVTENVTVRNESMYVTTPIILERATTVIIKAIIFLFIAKWTFVINKFYFELGRVVSKFAELSDGGIAITGGGINGDDNTISCRIAQIVFVAYSIEEIFKRQNLHDRILFGYSFTLCVSCFACDALQVLILGLVLLRPFFGLIAFGL